MLRAPSAHDTLPEYGMPVILHYSQGHWRPVPSKALIEWYAHGRWQQDTSFAGPPTSSGSSLNAIAMVSASEGWAVGSDGLIVHNLGGIWTRVSSPTDQTLWSLAMASPTDGWAVGDQGTILHYSHGAWSLYRG